MSTTSDPTRTTTFLGRAREWVRSDVRGDLPASALTFLAALPLSLGIAVASGAPAEAGLIAAAVGGIVAGVLGGVPLQVTGPAAGLTALTAQLVLDLGWRTACTVTVAAGAVQLLLGLTRGARILMGVSPAAVRGILAGVGTTIVLGQMRVLLGDVPVPSARENLLALPRALHDLHLAPTLTGTATVLVVLLWSALPRPVRALPAPLAAAALVTAGTQAVDQPRIGAPGNLLDALAAPELPGDHLVEVVVAVLTVAVVSGVETLLAAQALRRQVPGARGDLDRELLAQGSANALSGLLGGLPVAGVVLRGTGHVRAGARTRAATVLHGCWIVLFSAVLAGTLGRIPLAVLAGLLIVVGARLVGMSQAREVVRHGETAVFAVSLGSVVVFGVAGGLFAGLAAALLLALRQGVRAHVQVQEVPADPRGRWLVTLRGTVTFLALPRLSRELDRIPPAAPVHLELIADFLDRAVHEELGAWIAGRRAAGSEVVVDEVGPPLLTRYGDGDPILAGQGRPHPPRWLVPWSVWQAGGPGNASGNASGEISGPVSGLWGGMSEFHRRTSPMLSEVFTALADGQRPTTLFITCVDSRIVPNLITSSGPGDLFTVRTMGNLVPPPGTLPGDSTIAAVEYAVDSLRVSTIVVCGHSSCGAMHALQEPPAPGMPAVEAWLAQARSGPWSLDPARCTADDLSRANVVRQLEHLRAHTVVERALAEGRVHLVGLFFDIASGRSLLLREKTGEFLPFDRPLP
ncbi:MAG: carbonic anhydrase [Actinomycetota bacterium]|nr:carbonic anhydrase [Actinomycetota bacterium]